MIVHVHVLIYWEWNLSKCMVGEGRVNLSKTQMGVAFQLFCRVLQVKVNLESH